MTTGEGIAAAVAGADVVIDCLEGRSGKARKGFADGGARLLAAAQDAGTARAVMLSIVNCDRSNAAFYRSKAAKEHVYELSGLDTAVVRATQFHSLLGDDVWRRIEASDYPRGQARPLPARLAGRRRHDAPGNRPGAVAATRVAF